MKIIDILKHLIFSIKTTKGWKDIKTLVFDLINEESWIYCTPEDKKVEEIKIEYQNKLEKQGIKFQI